MVCKKAWYGQVDGQRADRSADDDRCGSILRPDLLINSERIPLSAAISTSLDLSDYTLFAIQTALFQSWNGPGDVNLRGNPCNVT